MTAHLVRTCNEHDVELRQIGVGEAARWVCPRGHSCEVDWTMKPAAKAPVAERPQAATEEPKRERKAMPKAKTEHPHGTRQRYWNGCRCQPCKDAISKHQRDRKGGGASRQRKAAANKTAVVRTRATKRKASIPALNLGALTARITSLREELAQAEGQVKDAIQATVRDVFPGYTFALEAE